MNQSSRLGQENEKGKEEPVLFYKLQPFLEDIPSDQ